MLFRSWRQMTFPGMGRIKREQPMYERTHKGGYKLSYGQEVYRKNTSDPYTVHHIAATHRGKEVGRIEWDERTSEIGHIEVNEKHRRKGIATAMYNMARSLPTKEKLGHAPERTDLGDAWAKTTEDYYPRVRDEHGNMLDIWGND